MLRPAADLLYRSLIDCPEISPEAQVIESALLRLFDFLTHASHTFPLTPNRKPPESVDSSGRLRRR